MLLRRRNTCPDSKVNLGNGRKQLLLSHSSAADGYDDDDDDEGRRRGIVVRLLLQRWSYTSVSRLKVVFEEIGFQLSQASAAELLNNQFV